MITKPHKTKQTNIQVYCGCIVKSWYSSCRRPECFPSTHVWCLRTTCNFSFKGSEASGLLCTHVHITTQRYRPTHNQNEDNFLKKIHKPERNSLNELPWMMLKYTRNWHRLELSSG